MNITLQQLIDYSKKEEWEAMDKGIPTICNDKEVVNWSLEQGITNENGNIRDLAVSILEKSEYVLTQNDISTLIKLMNNDNNIYVRFRAAFTLYNRGDRSAAVLEKMHQALEDDDVKGIAKVYLQQ